MDERSQQINSRTQTPFGRLPEEEAQALTHCIQSSSMSYQWPPAILTGALSFATATRLKMRRPIVFTIVGGFAGLFYGRVTLASHCCREVADKYPDGIIAKRLAAQKAGLHGSEEPTEYIGGGSKPLMTSSNQAPARQSDDYQAGFADTHNNVQHVGLADEKRRTVDNDDIPLFSKNTSEEVPRRATYEQLRQENRAKFEPQSQNQGPVYGGIFTPQDTPTPKTAPKPSLSVLENMEPRHAPPKPVRRNQYGDIIEE